MEALNIDIEANDLEKKTKDAIEALPKGTVEGFSKYRHSTAKYIIEENKNPLLMIIGPENGPSYLTVNFPEEATNKRSLNHKSSFTLQDIDYEVWYLKR